jgi:hypothetical protein
MSPMTPADLPNRIVAGESQTLEFKASFDKASIESLVAFANTQGGTVLVSDGPSISTILPSRANALHRAERMAWWHLKTLIDIDAPMSTIKLFETREVRSLWDHEKEAWFFSIVDVVAVLTDSPNPRTYWSVLKNRLKKEGSELATNCSQLKMKSADGKNYLTDVADTEQLLRLIQSIPSPKAEPFKQWLARVGYHPKDL